MVRDCKDYSYDVIFMDIQMPRMDGYEATKAIRNLENGNGADVPIIAMTANAFAEDVQAALASGMNGHIAKPLDLKSLADTLKKWVLA
jgi:CheY-like chemotaxis protein